jgi:shikimate kinase
LIERSCKAHFAEPMTTGVRVQKLVCLTGFMGSGKSTTARLLASQLGWSNIDLDRRIIEATGLSIAEIFARRGEPEFRRLEFEQLARLIAETNQSPKPRIVSLGGGTIAQPQNLRLLRENGVVLIWLHCPIEQLLLRCAQITDRPLFRDEASFRQLYEERLPSYRSADYSVDSSTEPWRVVEQILALGIFPKVAV